MLICRTVVITVLYCAACLARPRKHMHNGTDIRKKNIISGPDKRGTIRIAGPWHSESALDRNIDPGEDSYVKKIISSNEGINFNKDIAEAGEVFDVNGIEDFYDKNAMITYEVNGHEIPVHMKPKYTPQSKSMFPEYVRESPETLGSTRQAKANAHHTPSMNEKPDGRPSTFTGLSVKDMPEYNVHDSTDLSGIKEEGIQGDNKHFYHELPQPSHSQKENLNSPSLDHFAANHGISEETLARLKLLSSKLNTKHNQETEHSIGEFAAEYLRKKLEKEEPQIKPHHAELEIKDTNKIVEGNKDLSTPSSQLKLEQNSSQTEQENQKLIAAHHIETALSEHHNIEPSITHEQQQTNTFVKQEKPIQQQESSEGKLFQKLQSLHDKLNEDNAALRQSQQPAHSEESKNIEPEKAKAKAKILNLLGELTSKLKGMEAVVTGHHTDKEIAENNQEIKTSFDGQHRTSESEQKYVDKVPHSQMETVTHTEIEEKPSVNVVPTQTKLVDSLPSKIEEENIHAQNKRKMLEEYHRLTPADIYLYHHGKDMPTSEKINYINHDESAHQTKVSPEIIQKFSDQNKPFVMNTESIDYKPENAYGETESETVSGQMTATIRSSKARHDKDVNDIDEKEPTSKSLEKEHRKHYTESSSDESPNNEQREDEVVMQKNKFKHKHEEEAPTNEESVKETSSKKDEENERKESSKAYDSTDSFMSEDDGDRDRDYVAHQKSFKPKVEDIEYPDYNEVKDAAIFQTNLLRKRYHANKLRWSDRLSDEAQKEAEFLSRKSDLDNNKLDSYKKPGLNIALIKLDSPNVGKEATDVWEREVKNYDFRSPLVTKKNGDFVQLMWKGEKEFGLGVAKSKSGRGWVVTSYFDTPFVDKFQELKSNLQSDVPIDDPYQDIAG